MKKETKKGFTLLEILLVVAAIAILAGIVILAINPSKQLGDTKDAARRADVNTILNAVYQYSIDNNGSLPSGIVASSTVICKTDATATTSCADLSELTADGTYITAIPTDPDVDDTNNSGYEIALESNGRITVSAPNAYNGTISATR